MLLRWWKRSSRVNNRAGIVLPRHHFFYHWAGTIPGLARINGCVCAQAKERSRSLITMKKMMVFLIAAAMSIAAAAESYKVTLF
ncbi:MAG: hypothetical protein ABI972_09710, partial [Acidobacteriota bacterium]